MGKRGSPKKYSIWDMNPSQRKANPGLARYTTDYMCNVVLKGAVYSSSPPERKAAHKKPKMYYDNRMRLIRYY
jgi:hypothetical protein